MTFDLRTLDLPGFRRWLDSQMSRWQDDPVFVRRTRIRDLRRAHPQLRDLESERRRAAAADAATPEAGRLAALERRLHATAKAIAGLASALAGEAPASVPSLTAKQAASTTNKRRSPPNATSWFNKARRDSTFCE